MRTQEEEFFEISAVARLTGISSHVLRVWERRYGVVDPLRSDSKRRRYNREDIQRLGLLKTLVDHGHAIGSIAKLSTEQLEERLAQALEARVSDDSPEAAVPAGVCRLAVVGGGIRQAVRGAADRSPALRIIGEFDSEEEMLERLLPGSADLLLLKRPTVFPEDIREVRDLVAAMKVRRAILIYRFASEGTVESLDGRLITALRAPVEPTEIQLACMPDIQLALKSARGTDDRPDRPGPPESDEPIPERIFSDEQILEAGQISSVVKCECPQHLASLLIGLVAFEHYSKRCENRDDRDAALHAYLHRTTARARHEMEVALAEVLAQEGVEL